MKPFLRLVRWGLYLALAGAISGALAVGGAYLYFARDLPDVEVLRDTRMQVPLRVYSKDGLLVAEYGEKRRVPLAIEDIPVTLRDAFLAAEDERFYTHPGVDYRGILRAAISNYLTGDRGQGASTITMQVARNFFLSPEKTYTRKLREIFLSFKIEKELNKDEILELYLNKIYLGNRAYGVGAAAQVYYNKTVDELSLAEIAMIAGLPKAPSRYNPIVNPERAMERRNYVLRRLLELGRIDQVQFDAALTAPLTAGVHLSRTEINAPYLGEMVRAVMVERHGEEAYTGGYRVYTTIDAGAQAAANRALHTGLLDYDLRHGYRGPEARLEVSELPEEDGAEGKPEADAEALESLLQPYTAVGGLLPAVVVSVEERRARVYVDNLGYGVIPWEGMQWARRHIDESTVGREPESAGEVLARGDLVRVEPFTGLPESVAGDDGKASADEVPLTYWSLRQVPAVSGAVVSMRPEDGALLAVVGGFDFERSKFNRAVQAERQPGSVFKPFIYSAALEKGFTPATLVNDAPVVFDDPALEAEWRPENYSGRFYGPTRLRMALTKSRNLVSIRLLQSMGLGYGYRYVGRFGFDMSRLPRDLSLALGSGTITPLEMVRAYGVFANGGYLVEPYFIERIEDGAGEVLFTAQPRRVCKTDCEAVAAAAVEEGAEPAEPAPWLPAEQVVPPQNAYLITSMLRSVVQEGTGVRAMQLGRNDLSGKTGTTNDGNDAWFSGFNADVATTVWVGFDQLQPLGRGETGASAALPIWIDYMGEALAGRPEHTLPQPDGMVTVRIDPETGLLASSDNPDAIFETFRADNLPEAELSLGGEDGETVGGGNGTLEVPEQLF
ncbi:MAG: penicillin-binding protein 1A [Gammaproteobacteria bacterium]|nr:penicillin-binding protein 1A [Gammaproteobacteria bacterium]MDX5375371.1 penicillin-binding protein 1A [Gammaproteobacteria bacterium]